MKPIEIKKNIYWIGGLDPTLEIFDIVMETKYGTTYNSFLLKGDKIAIVETVKERFFDEFMSNIQSIVNPKDIDYVILNHTEPDHAGALRLLLEKAPHAQVLCSKPAYMYLKEMLNSDFNHRIVSEGDTLDLGQGKILKFICTPMLHWPDSIYSYLESEKMLFTCDSFGCHYSEGEYIFDDQIENGNKLIDAQKYYFDVIMSPFSSYVISAINKIKGLEVEIIAPGHGPILRSDPWKVVKLFQKWAEENQNLEIKNKIFIGYVSAYGYTERMAQIMKEEFEKLDYQVDLLNIGEEEISKLNKAIINSKAILIGSPTINQDTVPPVWNLLSNISPITQRGKVAAAFGSYGWSGEAVGMITERLKSLKLKVIEPGLKVKFVPSKVQMDECKDFARKIVEAL